MVRTSMAPDDAKLLHEFLETTLATVAPPMLPLILLYLWAALTVGLVLWLQAPRGTWRWNDLLAVSAIWPVGPVLYLLVR